MFINYAHRGASEYAPENTLSAFYLGILQGADGMETDIKRSRDGKLVLFHDEMLDRVTDAKGRISDYTWKELSGVLVRGQPDRGFIPDRMVSLQQFLYFFAFRDMHFAIEFKDRGVEEDTLRMVKRFGVKEKCIFVSFRYEDLLGLRRKDKSACIGYLTSEADEDTLARIKDIQAGQICLKSDAITPGLVEDLKRRGLSVRAWGVRNEADMIHVCECGVDGGMTINFPDKLHEYIKAKI